MALLLWTCLFGVNVAVGFLNTNCQWRELQVCQCGKTSDTHPKWIWLIMFRCTDTRFRHMTIIVSKKLRGGMVNWSSLLGRWPTHLVCYMILADAVSVCEWSGGVCGPHCQLRCICPSCGKSSAVLPAYQPVCGCVNTMTGTQWCVIRSSTWVGTSCVVK